MYQLDCETSRPVRVSRASGRTTTVRRNPENPVITTCRGSALGSSRRGIPGLPSPIRHTSGFLKRKEKTMWQPVDSSNIKAMKLEGKSLTVRFNSGEEYTYLNVDLELYRQILGSASVGRTFHELIRSKHDDHPYHRVA